MSWGKRLVPGGCVSGGLFFGRYMHMNMYIYIYFIYIWVASSYNIMDLFGWWFFTFYRGKSPLFQRHLGPNICWDSCGEELLCMGWNNQRRYTLRIHTLPDSSRFDGPNPIPTIGLVRVNPFLRTYKGILRDRQTAGWVDLLFANDFDHISPHLISFQAENTHRLPKWLSNLYRLVK